MTLTDYSHHYTAELHIGELYGMQCHPIWWNFRLYTKYNQFTHDQLQTYIADNYSAIIEIYDTAQFIGTDRWRIVFNDYHNFIKFVTQWQITE